MRGLKVLDNQIIDLVPPGIGQDVALHPHLLEGGDSRGPVRHGPRKLEAQGGPENVVVDTAATLYRVIGYGALPADGLLVDDTIDEGLKANTSAFGPLEYIHSLSLPYAKPCCMALSA